MNSCYRDLKAIRDSRSVELLSNCMSAALNRLRVDHPEAADCTMQIMTVDKKYIAFYNARDHSITLNTEDIKLEGPRTKAYWLLVLFHEYMHALQARRGIITRHTTKMYKEEGLTDVKVQIERDADRFALERFWRVYAKDLGKDGMKGYLDFYDARGWFLL
jgi:hypothetical protein